MKLITKKVQRYIIEKKEHFFALHTFSYDVSILLIHTSNLSDSFHLHALAFDELKNYLKISRKDTK
jgi:hypothetical protein